MYFVARLLYDTKLNMDKLLTDFCEKFYGAASDECIKYYTLNQSLVEKCALELMGIKAEQIPEIYSAEDVETLKKYLHNAKRSLKSSDKIYMTRLSLLINQVDEIEQCRNAVLAAKVDTNLTGTYSVEIPEFKDFHANLFPVTRFTEQLQRK